MKLLRWKKNISIRTLWKEEANILLLQAKIVTMLSIKFSSVLSGKVNIISNSLMGFMTSVNPCYLREVPIWKNRIFFFFSYVKKLRSFPEFLLQIHRPSHQFQTWQVSLTGRVGELDLSWWAVCAGVREAWRGARLAEVRVYLFDGMNLWAARTADFCANYSSCLSLCNPPKLSGMKTRIDSYFLRSVSGLVHLGSFHFGSLLHWQAAVS